MFKAIKRWLRKWANKNLGTKFEHTVLGLEMIYSNFDFHEDDLIMVIEGRVLIKQLFKLQKNRDGIFVVPESIAKSGKSYFVKFDGSVFVER